MLRPLRLKMCILRPLRLKLGILRPLRPLRLKMGILRLCATEETLFDFVQPKQDMLLLCATQIRYVATIATQNGYAATLCDPNVCATQNRYVATSRVEVCNLHFDRIDQKMVCFERLDPGPICFDRLDAGCLCFDYTKKMLR